MNVPSALSPWNSLEVAKLLLQAVTPVLVAVLGLYVGRVAKRIEQIQWRNQRLIEKRIAIYDELAPLLNDLLCYFTFIGCWKDLTPPDVVALKRVVDKKIYLAAPLFSPAFILACNDFMGLCYATFQGWGVDARLKTPTKRRSQSAGSKWQAEWDALFAEEQSDPRDVRVAYQRVMAVFSAEIGLNPGGEQHRLGGYPSNIG